MSIDDPGGGWIGNRFRRKRECRNGQCASKKNRVEEERAEHERHRRQDPQKLRRIATGLVQTITELDKRLLYEMEEHHPYEYDEDAD